jgi:hypothetical protein
MQLVPEYIFVELPAEYQRPYEMFEELPKEIEKFFGTRPDDSIMCVKDFYSNVCLLVTFSYFMLSGLTNYDLMKKLRVNAQVHKLDDKCAVGDGEWAFSISNETRDRLFREAVLRVHGVTAEQAIAENEAYNREKTAREQVVDDEVVERTEMPEEVPCVVVEKKDDLVIVEEKKGLKKLAEVLVDAGYEIPSVPVAYDGPSGVFVGHLVEGNKLTGVGIGETQEGANACVAVAKNHWLVKRCRGRIKRKKVLCEVCKVLVNPIGHSDRCKVVVKGEDDFVSSYLGDLRHKMDLVNEIRPNIPEGRKVEPYVQVWISAQGQCEFMRYAGEAREGWSEHRLADLFEAKYYLSEEFRKDYLKWFRLVYSKSMAFG